MAEILQLNAHNIHQNGTNFKIINNNLGINVSQYRRNLEAIQFGQESQSTYVTPPNPELAFATGVLNVANTYYGLEAEKANRGLQTNAEKARNRREAGDFGRG